MDCFSWLEKPEFLRKKNGVIWWMQNASAKKKKTDIFYSLIFVYVLIWTEYVAACV